MIGKNKKVLDMMKGELGGKPGQSLLLWELRCMHIER